MTDEDPVEDPVEILVHMAESGEIDPWNIDILEVTDRFLDELERRKELDLRISGRTLLYAAILLRMKSEHLEIISAEDEGGYCESEDDFSDPWFGFDIDPEDVGEPIWRLEREIQRRIGRKGMRRSPATLYELIKHLKTAEKEERRRQRQRRAAAPEMLILAEDVVEIAHDEDYQQAVGMVLQGYQEIAASGGDVTLASLCSRMGWHVRDVYIPLLFLMIDGTVTFSQKEFFGDIVVTLNTGS